MNILYDHAETVRCLAFSPDGKMLASGCDGGKVDLWDVAKGDLLCSIQAHRGRIWALGFSSDGRLLASAGNDVVKLWEPASLVPPRPPG
jgi:WD40 repeat protein